MHAYIIYHFLYISYSWTTYWTLTETLMSQLSEPTPLSSEGLTFGLWAYKETLKER